MVEEDGEVMAQPSSTGLTVEEVDVSIDNGVLTIKGEVSAEREHKRDSYLMREWQSGTFYPTLRPLDSLDQDKVRLVYKNGVLTVAFPKLPSKTPKRLVVKVEGGDSPSGDGGK